MSSSLILRTFDPLAQQVEHNTFNVGVLGSSPKRITEPKITRVGFYPQQGAIAQLVEQRTENPCVPGSIPGGTTHMVGWMSGLVSGLQNQPQRFESATDLSIKYRSLSSAGSERLPYKQRVGGSNPSATTKKNIVLQFVDLKFSTYST